VSRRADPALSQAAKSALTKIASVLPQDLRNALDGNSLFIGASGHAGNEVVDLAQIRTAIRSEHKIRMTYHDLKDQTTERTLWPIALGYFDHVQMLAGWCELRQEFRHFRTDRIRALTLTPQRYPRRRHVLLKEWHAADAMQQDRTDNKPGACC
jgi:predicted DNA-binding transcriptional regulator YafY